MQQAIYLDVALFVPGVLALLYGAAASNLPLNLPTEVIEYGSDAVVLAMIATIAYASASSLLGKTPDNLFMSKIDATDRPIQREQCNSRRASVCSLFFGLQYSTHTRTNDGRHSHFTRTPRPI
jgi:hypothetical protein